MATNPSPSPAGGDRQLKIVLLALIVLVVGVTIYVATRPPHRPVPPPRKTVRTDSTRQKVLTNTRDLIDAGQPAAACDLAQTYVRAFPADVEVRPLLAQAQIDLGDLQAASNTLKVLLKLAPMSARGLWMKGELERQLGKRDYLDYFRKAVESPGAVAAPDLYGKYGREMLHLGKTRQAKLYLNKAVAGGNRAAVTLEALGQLDLSAGQYESARKLLADAARSDPSATTLRMLSEALEKTGRLPDAEHTLRQAVGKTHGPQRGKLLMHLGALQAKLGLVAQAADSYAQASGYDAFCGQGALAAAREYYQIKHYAQAMDYIDQAVAALGDRGVVRQWRVKIENARFPREG